MKRETSLMLLVFLAIGVGIAEHAMGDMAFTQYYHSNSNVWLEISNVGPLPVDTWATGYNVRVYPDSEAEDWKHSQGAMEDYTTLGGPRYLDPGESILLRWEGNTEPVYAMSYGRWFGFGGWPDMPCTGNDSIVLYYGFDFSPEYILDAVSFTETGNEGFNTSFVRTGPEDGWNTTLGSSILDAPDIWQSTSLTTVDNALAFTDERLGWTSVVPEPGSLFLFATGLAVLLACTRANKSVESD